MAWTGRPPIYNTPEELQNAIDLYFITCDDPDKPIRKTITGLALALGFCDRQSLYDYEKRDAFSCIIKRAMLQVENSYENQVIDAKNAAGPIFVLKNMGWKDKNETELSGNIGIADALLEARKRANESD